jgi:hypothetical protein
MTNKKTDFGIEYNHGYPDPLNGYIDFSGTGVKGCFVFLEKLSDGKTNTIYIRENKMFCKANHFRYVCALKETIEGATYYLLKNPTRIIVESDYQNVEVLLQDDCNLITPIYINVFENIIITTFSPARMIVFSRDNIQKLLDFDLTSIGIKYPIYVEPYKTDCFLITDSKNHMVHIVDIELNILWEYGSRSAHGIESGLLFAPQRATFSDNGRLLISLRRGHCILIVNMDKHVEQILGVPFSVGGDGKLLWLPQAFFIGADLFVVMCEGAHISIAKYDFSKDEWLSLYKESPIKRSELCQPRSCEFSTEHEMLLISDTEHDRVVGYDLNGVCSILIDNSIIPYFDSPRCSIFHGNHLFITCSHKRWILYTDLYGTVLDQYIFDQSLAYGQWLQSIDYIEGKILVAFESEVVLLDWKRKDILWSSKKMGLKLIDVHYAQYLNENCYLISNNGQNQGVYIRGEEIRFITEVCNNGNSIKLSAPRFIKIIDNKMYILNTGSNQIFVCDPDTLNVISIYGGQRGLDFNRLSMPRWICKGPDGAMFISDTGNHRVVLRRV